MKKIFFLTFSLLATAFAYQGCKPADNSKCMMMADSMSDAKLVLLRDSLRMSCMNDVMMAAQMRADTMMMTMQNHGSSRGTKSKPAPPKATGVGNRPGSQQELPKTIGDRKGTLDSARGPKKISDRKGVNNPPQPK